MVATYIDTTDVYAAEQPVWAWDASETMCDGCGHRLASRAARIVSYGPTDPDGTSADRPRVFHRIQCATEFFDAQTLALGLQDLSSPELEPVPADDARSQGSSPKFAS